MKLLKYTLLLVSILTISCSDDNTDPIEDLVGQTGEIVLKFDNGVGDTDFIFETEYNKSNDESFQLTNLKYIISNVRFTDNEGNEFTYTEEDNIFIIDESEANDSGEVWLTLGGIDAADYVSVTFGVGVDQERYALGVDGQGDFLALANEKEMMWGWATGYKFVRFDGLYSVSTDDTLTEQPLNIHMGSIGTDLDNYKEITLDLPNSLIVREDTSGEIHIKADLEKVWDGIIEANFVDGYDQVHTDIVETPIIATNVVNMFEVHHVHND